MIFDPATIESRPWLIEPGRFPALLARVLAYKSCPTVRQLAKERSKRLEAAKLSSSTAIRGLKGRVGVIPCWGPVDQRLSSELMKAGGTSIEEMNAAFDTMMADQSVEAIVFQFDSPGGGSYGVEEFSDKIFAARGEKKCYAALDSMACSAAYWLASACETVCCTPSGDAGSVGVYSVHVDRSKAYDEEGVKMTFVSAGKYKTEFKDTEPLDDEAKAHMQADVDMIYAKFCKCLARNRGCSVGEVKANFGQGRVVPCDAAIEAKMVDRCMSFDGLMNKLLGRAAGTSGGKHASAELIRLRAERDRVMSFSREG